MRTKFKKYEIRSYSDINKVQKKIEDGSGRPTILIIDGGLSKELVPRLPELESLRVLIYCQKPERYQEMDQQYSMIKLVSKDFPDIMNKIEEILEENRVAWEQKQQEWEKQNHDQPEQTVPTLAQEHATPIGEGEKVGVEETPQGNIPSLPSPPKVVTKFKEEAKKHEDANMEQYVQDNQSELLQNAASLKLLPNETDLTHMNKQQSSLIKHESSVINIAK